jgi:hypothetical protein
MVSRVIAAPVALVWSTFTDPARRARWASDVDSVAVTVAEPGRRCVVCLTDGQRSHQREYVFTAIEVGPQRGGTVVTVADNAGFADRLLDLVVGGFVARTVEGAVRDELESLAAACVTRVTTLGVADRGRKGFAA